MYIVLYQQLANFSIHAGCSESAGDEEGRHGVLLVRRGGLMMYTVLYQQPVW